MPTRFAARAPEYFEPTIALARSRPPRWYWLLGAVAVCLVSGSYTWGHHQGSRVSWHPATAYIIPGHKAMAEADGRTVSVARTVAWTDGAMFHESGWPTCL